MLLSFFFGKAMTGFASFVFFPLSLVAQVRFIGDQNPFRESSAGVRFFGVSTLNPELYTVHKGRSALFLRPFSRVTLPLCARPAV